MESRIHDKDVLRDLALVYIAMAHGTDQELDDAEADAIVDRLHRWQAEAENEEIQDAVGNALQSYAKGEAAGQVERAVASIQEVVPQDMRQLIIEDLIDIALADGKFLYAENTFIADLAEAWDVHMDPPEEFERRWTVLSADQEDSWSTIHDLALVYIGLAHDTDHHLSSEEIEAITEKLEEWLPDTDHEEVLQVVKDALREYAQSSERERFDESVESIQRSVPAHQRQVLLEDLQYIADSDGELLRPEQDLIDELAKAWDMPEPNSL